MRLIDADALISTIVSVESEIAKKTPYEEHLFSVMAKRQHEIIDIIADAPTIDAVEVVRQATGHWNEDDDGIWCSNCETFLYFDENLKRGEKFFDYCPDCGARMDEHNG